MDAESVVKGNSMNEQRVMSGIRPTGRLHIGHYFGVLRNWLKLQDEYDCFFGVMNWHAMTSQYKTPHEIQASTRDVFSDYLAWGLDPERCTLFVQSEVPELLELYMYFSLLTPLGWLERVPTWKDAIDEAKQSDSYNLGRFGYPVLQAADIAIFHGSLVPIGQDQTAHLEVSREIIRRFNFLYGGSLPEPKALLTETPVLPGSDGREHRYPAC